MSETNSAAEFLTNHPRMLGVLFMAMLLLSQAGNVAAQGVGTTTGP